MFRNHPHVTNISEIIYARSDELYNLTKKYMNFYATSYTEENHVTPICRMALYFNVENCTVSNICLNILNVNALFSEILGLFISSP